MQRREVRTAHPAALESHTVQLARRRTVGVIQNIFTSTSIETNARRRASGKDEFRLDYRQVWVGGNSNVRFYSLRDDTGVERELLIAVNSDGEKLTIPITARAQSAQWDEQRAKPVVFQKLETTGTLEVSSSHEVDRRKLSQEIEKAMEALSSWKREDLQELVTTG